MEKNAIISQLKRACWNKVEKTGKLSLNFEIIILLAEIGLIQFGFTTGLGIATSDVEKWIYLTVVCLVRN